MPAFCICGIDPGISGALAFFFPEDPRRISAFDAPVVGKDLDEAAFARRLMQFKPDLVVIEQVASMPKQGVASTFRFGQAYGTARGVVAALGISVRYVTPQKWKKHFGLTSDKELSRMRAVQLWPTSDHFERKKDSGRAEAALLARYGADVFMAAQREEAA